MEKAVQCIKQIPYQTILDFRDELERLCSWGAVFIDQSTVFFKPISFSE